MAVSAYNGTEQPYYDAFTKAGYDLDIQVVAEQFPYSVQSVNNAARPKWKAPVLDELNKAYNGSQPLDITLANMQKIIDNATAANLASKNK